MNDPMSNDPLKRVQLSCLLVLGLGLMMSAGLWAVEVPACNAATAAPTAAVTGVAVAEPAVVALSGLAPSGDPAAPGGSAVAPPATVVTPAPEPAFILLARPCGANTCGPGTFCCNRSCGICAPLGGFCTQQVCAPVE